MKPGTLILGINGAWFGLAYCIKHLADEAHQLLDLQEAIFLGFHCFFICYIKWFPMFWENKYRLSPDRRSLIVLNELRSAFRVLNLLDLIFVLVTLSEKLCVRYKVNQNLVVHHTFENLKHKSLGSSPFFFRDLSAQFFTLKGNFFDKLQILFTDIDPKSCAFGWVIFESWISCLPVKNFWSEFSNFYADCDPILELNF